MVYLVLGTSYYGPGTKFEELGILSTKYKIPSAMYNYTYLLYIPYILYMLYMLHILNMMLYMLHILNILVHAVHTVYILYVPTVSTVLKYVHTYLTILIACCL